MLHANKNQTAIENQRQSVLLTNICDDLSKKSYSVQRNAIPKTLLNLLFDHVKCENNTPYQSAGIGRSADFQQNQNIRNDKIAWIDDDTPTNHQWISWMETLRMEINRKLYLGLTSLESHYARFDKGGFYQKHLDSFSGANNRKVSLVLFLNEFWKVADHGELKLFLGPEPKEECLISPELGTMVIFMSKEVPHEVLKTNSIRNSIAGWYR